MRRRLQRRKASLDKLPDAVRLVREGVHKTCETNACLIDVKSIRRLCPECLAAGHVHVFNETCNELGHELFALRYIGIVHLRQAVLTYLVDLDMDGLHYGDEYQRYAESVVHLSLAYPAVHRQVLKLACAQNLDLVYSPKRELLVQVVMQLATTDEIRALPARWLRDLLWSNPRMRKLELRCLSELSKALEAKRPNVIANFKAALERTWPKEVDGKAVVSFLYDHIFTHSEPEDRANPLQLAVFLNAFVNTAEARVPS